MLKMLFHAAIRYYIARLVRQVTPDPYISQWLDFKANKNCRMLLLSSELAPRPNCDKPDKK